MELLTKEFCMEKVQSLLKSKTKCMSMQVSSIKD